MSGKGNPYLNSIKRKTLLNLVEQSFSVKGLDESQAVSLAGNMFGTQPEPAYDIPQFKQGGELRVYFTHDIDWLDPLHPYSVIKSLLPWSKWVTLFKLTDPNLFIDNIGQLLSFEYTHGIKSVFLCGATDHTYGRYDLRYNRSCAYLQMLVRMLHDEGYEIGLHSGASESIRHQAQHLAALTGKSIRFHRSHFLHHNAAELYPALHDENIMVDFSSGHARQVGFKGNIARHYKAINIIQERITGVTVVPTVLFDNSFFFNKPETVFRQFRATLQKAKAHSSAVAVLFHPENMVIKPELWKYYAEIIHICKAENAVFNPSPDKL